MLRAYSRLSKRRGTFVLDTVQNCGNNLFSANVRQLNIAAIVLCMLQFGVKCFISYNIAYFPVGQRLFNNNNKANLCFWLV